MSFLAGFVIKMQEGEYDAEPKDEPKVCKRTEEVESALRKPVESAPSALWNCDYLCKNITNSFHIVLWMIDK
jgi:hypothetical protein